MKKTVLVLITFALIIAVAGSGFWLVHYFIDNREQRQTYETLAEKFVLESTPGFNSTTPAESSSPTENSSEPAETVSLTTAPPRHDLAALAAENPDCVGWLSAPFCGARFCEAKPRPAKGTWPPVGPNKPLFFTNTRTDPTKVRSRPCWPRVARFWRYKRIVQQVAALVIVNTQALLLDKDIGGANIQLHTGAEGHGAQRAMRRHRHVVGLCHSGDLLALADSPSMGKVRLNDVHIPVLKQIFKIPAGEHPLPGGNGRGGIAGNFPQCFVILRQHRLLDEHQVEGVQLFCQNLRHGLVHPAVEIHRHIQVVTQGIPDGGHPLADSLHLFKGIDIARTNKDKDASLNRLL